MYSMYQAYRHMNSKEHSDLEEWARTFGGTAILGFISTLLLGGKLLHHVLSMRGDVERALFPCLSNEMIENQY